MMRVAVARAVSIVGHPVVLVLVAALISASAQGASHQQLRLIGGALATFAVIVVGFSWLQVRTGRWSHVDASVRNERNSLNVFLVALCLSERGAALVSDAPALHVRRIGIVGRAHPYSVAICQVGESLPSRRVCRIRHGALVADQGRVYRRRPGDGGGDVVASGPRSTRGSRCPGWLAAGGGRGRCISSLGRVADDGEYAVTIRGIARISKHDREHLSKTSSRLPREKTMKSTALGRAARFGLCLVVLVSMALTYWRTVRPLPKRKTVT